MTYFKIVGCLVLMVILTVWAFHINPIVGGGLAYGCATIAVISSLMYIFDRMGWEWDA
jgi:hypothetical protein